MQAKMSQASQATDISSEEEEEVSGSKYLSDEDLKKLWQDKSFPVSKMALLF